MNDLGDLGTLYVDGPKVAACRDRFYVQGAWKSGPRAGAGVKLCVRAPSRDEVLVWARIHGIAPERVLAIGVETG